MNVLVTGAAGYLGSVLCGLLLYKGHKVMALDNFKYNQTSLSIYCSEPNFKLIYDDCNCSYIDSLVKENDFVIPLAALVGAPVCNANPDEALRVNALGVRRIKDAIQSSGTRIIFPNTNSGYGTTGSRPCTENTPLNPISIYGKTKAQAEQLVLNAGGISFRFATLFGCSPRMRVDLLVNDFVLRAIRDKALTLFEPHFRRNYLHVRDAANVFIWAMENYDKMKGQAYNVGLPDANLTKLQLAKRIEKYIPQLAIFEAHTAKDPDQRDYLVSNDKILATGWRPEYSLDNGIVELIKASRMFLKSPWANQ